MTRTRRIVSVVLAAVLAACGDAEAPTAPYLPELPNPDPSLAGTFHGTFNGWDQGVTLAASVQFSFAESSGVVTGTFGIQGRLDDGQSRTDVAGTGLLSGTVEADDDAAVSFTTESDLCSGHSGDFVGTYFRSTGVLGIAGAVDILDQTCTVVHSYPIEIAMRR